MKRLIALLAVIGITACVLAQPIFRQAGPSRRFTEVVGSKVLVRGGTAYGVVQDLVFDDAGCITYAICADGDAAYSVPYSLVRVGGERTVIVDVEIEHLRRAPHWSWKGRMPDLTTHSEWSKGVHQHFKVEPRHTPEPKPPAKMTPPPVKTPPPAPKGK